MFAAHPKWHQGKGGDGRIEAKTVSEDMAIEDCLRHAAALCQQDLRKHQNEVRRMRQELEKFTEKQDEIQEEYTVITKALAAYQEACREITAGEVECGRQLQALSRRQQSLQEEYALNRPAQSADSPELAEQRNKLGQLLTAKRETQAVIAENLTKLETLTERLANLLEQATLPNQQKKIQEDIVDLETQLNYLEREKQKLIKCLSLLTAQKPEAYVLLDGSREEQAATVAQYNQYLVDFVAAVQKVERQQQVPIAAFLQQDISSLLDGINTLKQRQVDLRSPEIDTINQVRELSHVLEDMAQDYGWTTSLLKPDKQGVMVNLHSIGQLRQTANDLLVVAPPGLLAKMGLCAQWKKSLFDLIIKAKSMEELAYSPEALRRQIRTELENVLLQCRHLTQRIYETSYRHLSACGHSLDQAYNKIAVELTDLTKQLLKTSKEAQSVGESSHSPVREDELKLRHDLEKTENRLQELRHTLRQQEEAISESRQAMQEDGAAVGLDFSQEQADDELVKQTEELEQQRQQMLSRLEEKRRQLTAVESTAKSASDKLTELRAEKATVAAKITSIGKQLEDKLCVDNEIRISLVTEWIKRLQEHRPESRGAVADRITATRLPGRRENKVAGVENIALGLANKEPGLMLLEIREWLLPAAVIGVGFTLEGSRQYSATEEFIMKCMASGLSALGSKAGIAELLNLPAELVAGSIESLCEACLVRECSDGGETRYQLTEAGREVCHTGQLATELFSGTAVIMLNAQYELLDAYKEESDSGCADGTLPLFRYYNHQEEQALRNYFPADNQEVSQSVQGKLQKWYTIPQNDYKTVITGLEYKQDCKLRFAEIWLYDALKNQVFCRVWNFAKQEFCEKLEFALHSLEGRQRFEQLQAACSANTPGAAVLKAVQKQENAAAGAPGWEILYGINRRNAWLKALTDLQAVMVLMVPDLGELVADSELIKHLRNAVSRGSVIFVGWGIAGHSAGELQTPAAAAAERLKTILDADGLPGVLPFQVGKLDSHCLLVDSRYCLLDGLPYEQYSGQQTARSQPLIKVLDKQRITEQSVNWQGVLLKQLETQLLSGCLEDEAACFTWFYALLKLSEHRYIREVLADEALAKVMTGHADNMLFKLLLVYVKAESYDFGFSLIVAQLAAKPDSYAKLTYWLDKLRIRNPKAYNKITLAAKSVLKRR
ncbi:MAG: hypothetical protein H6Q72_3212 [Firmicutes bacterium]|nr:hypothetical protein [Bacillota bacterium]